MTNIYLEEIVFWLKKKKIKFNKNTDLFSVTDLDSFSFIELLFHIEKKFQIKLKHEKIFLKNKLTLIDLASLIKKSANKKT